MTTPNSSNDNEANADSDKPLSLSSSSSPETIVETEKQTAEEKTVNRLKKVIYILGIIVICLGFLSGILVGKYEYNPCGYTFRPGELALTITGILLASFIIVFIVTISMANFKKITNIVLMAVVVFFLTFVFYKGHQSADGMIRWQEH